jgi:hypothetical protein
MKDLQAGFVELDVHQEPYLVGLELRLAYDQRLLDQLVTEVPQREPDLGRLAPHQRL